jgi:hypothetical protein
VFNISLPFDNDSVSLIGSSVRKTRWRNDDRPLSVCSAVDFTNSSTSSVNTLRLAKSFSLAISVLLIGFSPFPSPFYAYAPQLACLVIVLLFVRSGAIFSNNIFAVFGMIPTTQSLPAYIDTPRMQLANGR